MTLVVAPIVEGETEEECIKAILSGTAKLVLGVGHDSMLRVLKPLRTSRSAFIQPGHEEFKRKIERARIMLKRNLRGDNGVVLILLDAEEDLACRLAPQLLAAARGQVDVDVVCVFPTRMLENWFKAAAKSLAGVNGLPSDLDVPKNPETGNGAAWLTTQLQKVNKKRKYTKPGDSSEFAKKMDFQQCRDNSPSFDKLCRDLKHRLLPPKASEPQ